MDKSQFETLEQLLGSLYVPYTSKHSNRRGFPKHRRTTFGLVKPRFSGSVQLSAYSKRYPEVYAEILKIGDLIKNYYPEFTFNSIHLNKSVTCPPHKDAKNIGQSVIISLGSYTGGVLVVEGEICNAHYNFVKFNGAEKEHWNTDDLIGDKYSLIFYTTALPKSKPILQTES